MTFSQVFAVLMMVAAIFVFMNERFLHFPFTIGLTVLSLGFSIFLILCELVGIPFGHTIFLKLLTLIDFKTPPKISSPIIRNTSPVFTASGDSFTLKRIKNSV